jgi:hypothetical protein
MPETLTRLAEPQNSALDRIKLAVQLRRAGVDVDIEDWDGMSDDHVRQVAQYTGLDPDIVYGKQMVLNAVEQGAVVLALHAGDRGMFERAAQAGVFGMLTEMDHEV